MTKTLFGLVLIAIAFWSPPLRAETLCVKVVRSNQPVANMPVTVGSVRKNTDGSGRVCFENIAAGNYAILIGSGHEVQTCYGSTSRGETVCRVP